MEYEQVFYVNTKPSVKMVPPGGVDNNGFDTAEGEYIVGGVGDHISYRYEVLKGLGKGSFG